MPPATPLPLALRIVAVVTLLSGISSAFQVIYALAHARLFLDFGVLGIFAYLGLRRLSSGWRLYLLICTWLGILVCPLVALLALAGAHTTFNIGGIPVSEMDPAGAMVVGVLFLAYMIWQLSVLNRADVVQLFRDRVTFMLRSDELTRREGRGL